MRITRQTRFSIGWCVRITKQSRFSFEWCVRIIKQSRIFFYWIVYADHQVVTFLLDGVCGLSSSHVFYWIEYKEQRSAVRSKATEQSMNYFTGSGSAG